MENVTVASVQNLSKNGIIIYLTNGTRVFNSYGVNVAEKDNKGQIKLDKRYWDYSVTTSKDRCQFLGERKPETEKKIKNGEYILTDLN